MTLCKSLHPQVLDNKISYAASIYIYIFIHTQIHIHIYTHIYTAGGKKDHIMK